MFEIKDSGDGTLRLCGRFGAAEKEIAKEIFDKLTGSTVIDFVDLEYISSAGLGVLLGAEKRLRGSDNRLTLVNLSPHIREIFRIAGFEQIFNIE